MLLIMLTVLMFHLQSFQRLFMVLAILPLGLIGVVAAPAGRSASWRYSASSP
jgi:multidrug efflux pump subunit AcrB